MRAPADISPADRERLVTWFAADRARASWHNTRRAPIRWALDSTGYRPTPLIAEIISQAGLDRRPLGSTWCVLPDGRTLAQVAAQVSGGVDWTPLHAVLAGVGADYWTTYGDLAQAVGTGAVALGNHVAECALCQNQNAQRVLGGGGVPREGFAWLDPRRTDTQEAALAAERVTYVNGHADPGHRVDFSELQALAKGVHRRLNPAQLMRLVPSVRRC